MKWKRKWKTFPTKKKQQCNCVQFIALASSMPHSQCTWWCACKRTQFTSAIQKKWRKETEKKQNTSKRLSAKNEMSVQRMRMWGIKKLINKKWKGECNSVSVCFFAARAQQPKKESWVWIQSDCHLANVQYTYFILKYILKYLAIKIIIIILIIIHDVKWRQKKEQIPHKNTYF